LTPKKNAMQKVKDILAKKGAHIESVPPNTPVIDALKTMAEKNYGSVAVTENGIFLGIFTERDYSRKVVLQGKNSSDTTVGEIMSKHMPSVTPNDTIEHCMSLMNDQRIRYLPVYNDGGLAGIISMTDVVSATIARHEETISQLESYITRS
jgi:CBS domain-containing protein